MARQRGHQTLQTESRNGHRLILVRAIGIYLLKFNSVKVLVSEGQDAGEEDDDYYVGQTLASFEERLGRHEYFLGKNSAQLRAIYANKLPVLYRKGPS